MKNSSTPSFSSINKLAIPSIISGLSEPIVSMTDTAFVGTIGKTELAAVGIASTFILLILWVFSSAKSAMASIVGQAYGAQKLTTLHGLILQSVILLFIIGFLVSGVVNIFSSDIFTSFYKAEGDILDACNAYYNIRWWGVPFMLSTYIIFGILKGLQNTSIAMGITLVGALLNILLDAILIIGIDGYVTPMGIEGAAIATTAAQVVMFLMAIMALKRQYPEKMAWSKLIVPHSKLPLLFTQSTHLFLRTALLNLTITLAIRYATSYGESVVATHHIIAQFLLFAAFFVDGYANAGIAIAGRLYGANEKEILGKLNKKLLLAGLVIAIFMMIIYGLGYNYWGSIFTNDKKVLLLFKNNFWLLILMLPINSISFIMDGIFIGIGKTNEMFKGMLIASLAVFIPTILFFDWYLGTLSGIWIALILWMSTRASYLYYSFSSQKNKGHL